MPVTGETRGRLPEVIVIGAQKGGTTSLWRYLDAHPQVHMAPGKELSFFVAEHAWSRGVDWYAEQFTGAADGQLRGEASPQYTRASAFAGVPERMRSVVPEARLVYVVRHPVERAVSAYQHRVIMGEERRPATTALLEDAHYWRDSCYAWQLSHYLPHFPLEQILVVRSEDLRADRQGTLRRIWSFIGVDPTLEVDGTDTEYFRTADRRKLPDPVLALVRTPLYQQVRERVPHGLRRSIAGRFSRRVGEQRADVPTAVTEELAGRLAPDVDSLAELLGPTFEPWDVGSTP